MDDAPPWPDELLAEDATLPPWPEELLVEFVVLLLPPVEVAPPWPDELPVEVAAAPPCPAEVVPCASSTTTVEAHPQTRTASSSPGISTEYRALRRMIASQATTRAAQVAGSGRPGYTALRARSDFLAQRRRLGLRMSIKPIEDPAENHVQSLSRLPCFFWPRVWNRPRESVRHESPDVNSLPNRV